MVLGFVLLLSACSRMGATVEASPDVNPGLNGEPEPIALRIFFLKQGQRFRAASSRELFITANQTLGGDLLGVTQIMLAPGASIWWERAWPAQTQYIGVAADYRNLWRLPWRIIEPVSFWEKHLGGDLLIQVARNGLQVK